MKLSQIKPNPNNPRIIKDAKFDKLKKSIQEFPAMMELRPMIIDADNVVLGGNMRLKALTELGYKDIPDTWVKRASDLTEDEKQRFIVADNVGFGEWDWEELANEWNAEELGEWGVDIPSYYSPVLEPGFGSSLVSDEDMNRAKDGLRDKMDNRKEQVQACCPNCGHEFMIDP